MGVSYCIEIDGELSKQMRDVAEEVSRLVDRHVDDVLAEIQGAILQHPEGVEICAAGRPIALIRAIR